MINHEEMSERKLKILHAIIQNYLETGEPVGSRTISKYTDLNLSSATIRNEMADLEEMGYIIQPHTSAGRIPSDKGYRLYVDMLMEEKEQELNEMQDQMLDKADKMDQLLKQAAKVLATNTNYATMVSTPMNNSNKIKFIQLSMVDEEQVIAVIVLGGNVIKNKIINIDEPISNENLLKLNMLLNTTLNGMSIEEINLGLIARLKEQAGIHSQVVGYVLDAVADAIHVDDDMQIYTSGATNIFKYPELSDNQSAQEIISAFEEKQQLSELVTQTLAQDENTGIQVYIGDETPVQTMRDCSVVTATYELGDGMKIEEINLGLIARLKEQAGIHSQVVGYVLDAVADAIHVDDDMQIYTSGATNIFKYPELSDNQSAQEIISAFEEKQQLSELVTQTLAQDENTGIQVYIGDETPVQTMRDCSVVTATYELGDGMKGTIGIIGPKRMDYEHVLKSCLLYTSPSPRD